MPSRDSRGSDTRLPRIPGVPRLPINRPVPGGTIPGKSPDPAGVDNTTDVTLGGSLDYLAISGQVITPAQVDLTTDVTGDLPVAEGGTGSSSASGARTNLGAVADSDEVDWTKRHLWTSPLAATVPLTIKAHAAQSGALTKWVDSSGATLLEISESGILKPVATGIEFAAEPTGNLNPVVHQRLSSTANAKGASLIGIEDSAGNITATTVEAALAELAAASGGLTTEQVQDIVGAMFTGNTETRGRLTYEDGDGTIDLVVDDLNTDTQLTQEQVEDFAGALIATGGTKTGITVTYQDGTGDVDFVVSAQDHGGLGGLGDDDHTQYSKADGTRAFTGAVVGVQGTGDTNLCTNLTAFQRPFNHSAYRSGTFTNGQQIRLFLNTTDNDANFVIPAGQTLYVLAAYGRCKSGATAGTTTWTLGIQTWETQAHAGARDWDLATGTTTSTNSYINIEAQGTLASPLAAIVGNDDPVGMVFIEHANDGGGTSGNDKHTIMVYGVFV